MATYLVLSGVFLAIIGVLSYSQLRAMPWRSLATQVTVLCILTAVFDNLIIYLGIVTYDPSRISGLYLGRAPIEDFAYSIGAVMLIPYLWHKKGVSR